MKLKLNKHTNGSGLTLVYYKPGAVTEAIVYAILLSPIFLITLYLAIAEDGLALGFLAIIGLLFGLFFLFIISIAKPTILFSLFKNENSRPIFNEHMDISRHIGEEENLLHNIADNFKFIRHIRLKKKIKFNQYGEISTNKPFIPKGSVLQSIAINPFLQMTNNRVLQHKFVLNFKNSKTEFIVENNYNDLIQMAEQIKKYTNAKYTFDTMYQTILEKYQNRFNPEHIRTYKPKTIYTFSSDDMDVYVRKWHGKWTILLFLIPPLAGFFVFHLYGGTNHADIITTADKLKHTGLISTIALSLYYALAMYANRSEIRIYSDHIVLDIKPTPWPGIKHLNMDSIQRIAITSTDRIQPYPYDAFHKIDIIMNNDKRHRVFDKVETRSEAEQIKKVIEQRLAFYRLNH